MGYEERILDFLDKNPGAWASAAEVSTELEIYMHIVTRYLEKLFKKGSVARKDAMFYDKRGSPRTVYLYSRDSANSTRRN